jgi:hypothetical protein
VLKWTMKEEEEEDDGMIVLLLQLEKALGQVM